MNDLEFLKSEEAIQFVLKNLQADPQKLLLNPPTELKGHIHLLVDQIISRRKAAEKFPDWANDPTFIFPPPLSVEQASSPPTALYKARLMTGKTLVDLTGGMGVDTIYMSTSFEQTYYVEQNPWLASIFAHNAANLHLKIEAVCTKAENFLNEIPGKSSIYIDPARRDQDYKRVFRFEECSPNVIELLPALSKKGENILIKAAPILDIKEGIKQLKLVKEVHVVSVKNEVKELLFLVDFQEHDDPRITCVNRRSDQPDFEFSISEEAEENSDLSDPKEFLYDPNASILKAGAFKSIAKRYDLGKIATNTHLYTSDTFVSDFPGRIFKVISKVSKKEIQKSGFRFLNVITKNHPMKPEQLLSILKLKSGGDQFLIGFTNQNNRPNLILAERLV